MLVFGGVTLRKQKNLTWGSWGNTSTHGGFFFKPAKMSVDKPEGSDRKKCGASPKKRPGGAIVECLGCGPLHRMPVTTRIMNHF